MINKEQEKDAVAKKVAIAAVKYARQTLQASRLRTFRKEDGRTQNMSVIFHNNTSNPIADINLGVELPEGWQSEMIYMQEFESILPGHGVSAVFRITMPDKDDAGFAKATAEWQGWA